MAYIIGKKIGMTRVVNNDGKLVPVTLIEAIPNKVHQVKTEAKDGYNAVALEALVTSTKKPNIREFKVTTTDGLKQGQSISVDTFSEVDSVCIQASSKGKGFQGGIKRHNFSAQGKTHGVKGHRHLGSTGACAYPGRVTKGKKMPGHMGARTVTIKDIPVVKVENDKNIIALKGPVPGSFNSLIKIWSNEN